MEPEGTPARHWAVTLCRNAGFDPDVTVRDHRPPAGQHPTIALQQLPLGQRTRGIFTAVRRGRSQHPAALACQDALRRVVTVR
jgi:hypothetical protein